MESPYQVSGKPGWLLLLLWVASKCVGWWQSVQRELWPFSEAAAADSPSPTLHTSVSSQPGSPWLLTSSASPSQLHPFPLLPAKRQPSPELSPLERARLYFTGSQGMLSVGAAWQKCGRWLREGGIHEMQAPLWATEIYLFPWG